MKNVILALVLVPALAGCGELDFTGIGDGLAAAASLRVTNRSLPDGAENVAYRQTLTATGGDGSYVWSVTVGSLPTGLSLNTSTGLISGTPTEVGTFDFTVEVGSGGATTPKALSITVNATAP